MGEHRGMCTTLPGGIGGGSVHVGFHYQPLSISHGNSPVTRFHFFSLFPKEHRRPKT